MAHTSRCAAARTSRCNCCCNYLLHGGLAGGLFWVGVSSVRWTDPSARGKTTKRQSGRRHSVMSRAKDEITDWLGALAAAPSPSVATATSQALDVLSDTVATAIVNALYRSGYHWSQADHVLCDFLAATACAMHKFEDQFQSQVEHIVTM